MFAFGKTSRENLSTCHPLLQLIFDTVILQRDCSIVCGRRDKATQELYFEQKKTKVHWPDSKHNVINQSDPSLAVDAVPYINHTQCWKTNQCYHFAGYVLRVADELAIPVRWGGDWDKDMDVNDQNFNDLVHFELIL